MDMQQLTKIILAWELYGQGVPKTHIARQLSVHRGTVHLWICGITRYGLDNFTNRYLGAKKGERAKRKVDGLLKNRIYNLREKHRQCCGQKIAKYLFDDYGIRLSPKTIYKILALEYKLRSKWKKNQKRGPVPVAFKPREVIQMDTVDFGFVFAFTAVDIFSKDVSVGLYPSLTSHDGAEFLKKSFNNRFHHTDLLQTDGGSEFKDQFRRTVFKYANRFRVARPYRKNEQAYIESFNRTLRKECLGWGHFKDWQIPTLQKEVDDYLVYYHTQRAHLTLNLRTPNDILREYKVSDI